MKIIAVIFANLILTFPSHGICQNSVIEKSKQFYSNEWSRDDAQRIRLCIGKGIIKDTDVEFNRRRFAKELEQTAECIDAVFVEGRDENALLVTVVVKTRESCDSVARNSGAKLFDMIFESDVLKIELVICDGQQWEVAEFGTRERRLGPDIARYRFERISLDKTEVHGTVSERKQE